MSNEEKDIALQVAKVGERFKQLRIEQGFTSYENFAIDKEISRMQYWRIENGTNITLNSFFKTLQLLNTTPEDFFKDFSSKS